jgi:hypothetical protein
LEALADGEASGSEAGGVSVCLEIYTAETRKKRVLNKYCYKDVAGTDVFEGKTYKCENSDYPSSSCNKVTCKTSQSYCHEYESKQHN